MTHEHPKTPDDLIAQIATARQALEQVEASLGLLARNAEGNRVVDELLDAQDLWGWLPKGTKPCLIITGKGKIKMAAARQTRRLRKRDVGKDGPEPEATP